jgi:hypothetical protein
VFAFNRGKGTGRGKVTGRVKRIGRGKRNWTAAVLKIPMHDFCHDENGCFFSFHAAQIESFGRRVGSETVFLS